MNCAGDSEFNSSQSDCVCKDNSNFTKVLRMFLNTHQDISFFVPILFFQFASFHCNCLEGACGMDSLVHVPHVGGGGGGVVVIWWWSGRGLVVV